MDTSFSLLNNAKRAAERMIRAGAAPSIDYGLRTREDGRVEIVWKTGERPGMHCAEAEAAPTAIETELAAEMLEKVQAEGWPGPDADGKDGEHEDEVDKAIARERIAEIEEHPEHLITGPALAGANGGESSRAANDPAESDSAATAPPPRPASAAASAAAGAEQDPELAGFETPRLIGELQRRGYRTAQARQSRTQRPARGQRMSKAAELDEAAARGVMPTKPDVTSHANHYYQRRFDKLAELAAAGDWDAVAGYECNGINSYAKMVRQYRDRLLAAHAASKAAQ